MILMRKEAENVPWLMCASRGRRKSAPERFCFAESALAGESQATKKPGKPGFLAGSGKTGTEFGAQKRTAHLPPPFVDFIA